MKKATHYILSLELVDSLSPDENDTLIAMAAQCPGFHGALESEIDVPSSDKILGIADEFFDLGSRYEPKKKISFWFSKKAEAAFFLQKVRTATPWVRRAITKKEPPKDWMQAWRKHYRPLYFSADKKKIAVIPAWEKLTPRARKANAVIRIHPGQAFGAGYTKPRSYVLRRCCGLTSHPKQIRRVQSRFRF